MTPIELKQHQILFDIRDVITHVYFAFDAVVSLVIPLATGEVVETAMAGRDSVIGSGAALKRQDFAQLGHRTNRRACSMLSG
ncbi:MAG: hypothetical protein WA366_25665 [Pseudolabrys sp.]